MNPVLYQEKGLIDTYQELVQKGKHPTLARLSGKLIIYTQDRDSLIEKISQFVYQAFVTLSTFFGATFQELTEDNINEIEEAFKTAFLEKYGEAELLRKNPELAQVEQQLAQITPQVEALREEWGRLTNERATLRGESYSLKLEIETLKELCQRFRRESDSLFAGWANAVEKEQSVESLENKIKQLKYDIQRYEHELTPLYQKWSQTDLVKARTEVEWLDTELNRAKRYILLMTNKVYKVYSVDDEQW